MKTFNRLILLTLFVSQALFAQIIESKKMTEILSSVNKDTIVVFDLDNTIMESAQTVGSDQWFEHRLHQQQQAGLPIEEAVKATVGEWEAINRAGKVQLVEENTPAIIEALQDRGIPTMGLTARSVTFADDSLRQLHQFDIRFTRSTISQQALNFFDKDKAVYQEGLMVVGGNNKGKMLLTLFDRVGYKAKRVVFVDDKQKNVKNVDDALNAVSIPSFAYRYGAADPKVQAFDAKLADFEFGYFKRTGKVLSDSEAKQLMH